MSFLPAGVRYLAASTCTAIYLPIHPSTLPGLFLPGLPFFGRWPNLASAARLLQPPIRYLLQPPRAPFPIHCVPPSPESLLADGRRSFTTVLRLLRSFGLPGNRLCCLHATDSWGRLRSALPAHSRLGDQSIISPPPRSTSFWRASGTLISRPRSAPCRICELEITQLAYSRNTSDILDQNPNCSSSTTSSSTS